jgi:ribulose-phosphate 3-epimerase
VDNHFVPNLTWGPSFVNQIAQYTNKPLSIHLMVENPETIIEQLRVKQKSIIIVHQENNKTDTLIDLVHAKKLQIGVALKPKTDLETIFSYVKKIDQVMLMSVEPGFSGQAFIAGSVEKLRQLDAYKKQHDLTFEIAMDGGINQNNIHELAQQGCSIFCVASAIFNAKSPVEALKMLYDNAL